MASKLTMQFQRSGDPIIFSGGGSGGDFDMNFFVSTIVPNLDFEDDAGSSEMAQPVGLNQDSAMSRVAVSRPLAGVSSTVAALRPSRSVHNDNDDDSFDALLQDAQRLVAECDATVRASTCHMIQRQDPVPAPAPNRYGKRNNPDDNDEEGDDSEFVFATPTPPSSPRM